MPVKWGLLAVAYHGSLYVTPHKKTEDGVSKKGIVYMRLGGWKVSNKYLQWQKNEASEDL